MGERSTVRSHSMQRGWGTDLIVEAHGPRHAPPRLPLAAVALAALALAPTAQALRSTPADTYVTNGPVYAVVPTADATYIGGNFTQVGPRTGPGVGIDSSTGKTAGLPQVTGGSQNVRAAARDGSGGYYIGGDFTHVGGLPRRGLAHILADGRVDPSFKPNAQGPEPFASVNALAVSGQTVYAGGEFTRIGGKPRDNVAALDRGTGQATAWNPGAEGSVLALAVSGQTIYAGGFFDQIGGKTRSAIAALDRTTGQATAWNPNATDFEPDTAAVHALAVSGKTVYAAGFFDHIGGRARNNIAALGAGTGRATAWNPNAGYQSVLALALSGQTIYVGGYFSSIGGKARAYIAALDPATGKATAWNPGSNGPVETLAVSGQTAYAGGYFTRIGGKSRNNIAALDRTGERASAWNPNANDSVYALAVSGGTVYAGGDFSSLGGKSRNNIAALDPKTGEPSTWNPNASGDDDPFFDSVDALAVSGQTVYAGGAFTRIGGQPRENLAALDAGTGATTAWNPDANHSVESLVVSGQTVYAGGDFHQIGGKGRNNIAALDRVSGDATSWNPNVRGESVPVPFARVDALAVTGQTVYAGGYFTRIGGQPRSNLAALDRATGRATAWHPNAGGPAYPFVNALVVSGQTVYAGGAFTRIGGELRNHIAALDAGSGAATSWNPNANHSVESLTVSGQTVYAGGYFSRIGGVLRDNLAALSSNTGAAGGWNPQPNNAVEALAFGPDGSLWAGGEFSGFPTAPQEGIARFRP